MDGHSALSSALKSVSNRAEARGGETHAGTITSISQDGRSARVTIMPGGTLSGWLPIGQCAVGANALIIPPNPGDLVLLEPLEGDSEQFVITARLFSTQAMPPVSPATGQVVQPGELAIIMQNGSFLHFAASGEVFGQATSWSLKGNVAVTGNITATGEITRGQGGADQVTLGQHIHTGNSEPPEPGH